MATYNVHGGHSLSCRGAAKYLDEVNEDRIVKNKVIQYLRSAGHTVYDCTDDYGTTVNGNLAAIVQKCNAHNVDLDISIHLNAGGGTGCEVWNYDSRTAENFRTSARNGRAAIPRADAHGCISVARRRQRDSA